MAHLRLYDVIVRWADGKETTSSIYAKSKAAARYEVFRSDAFSGCSFREFMGFTRVRASGGPPSNDCYGYVRKAYGVDVRIGQRVTLRDVGARLDGEECVVAYPGTSTTAYVHLIAPGFDHVIRVHPSDVTPSLAQGASE